MPKWDYLSYLLDPKTPSYGNRHEFRGKAASSIAEGGSSNTAYWHFHNHLGTHLDFPKHFVEKGDGAEAFPADFWFCDKVTWIDCPLDPGELLVEAKFLEKVKTDLSEVEALIIKSGFSRFRTEDMYWENNPSIAPALATAIRSLCPSLKFLGMDSISFTAFQHRAEGRETHLALLGEGVGKPKVLIEDMDLRALVPGVVIEQLIVSPLRVAAADGGPATVLAKLFLPSP